MTFIDMSKIRGDGGELRVPREKKKSASEIILDLERKLGGVTADTPPPPYTDMDPRKPVVLDDAPALDDASSIVDSMRDAFDVPTSLPGKLMDFPELKAAMGAGPVAPPGTVAPLALLPDGSLKLDTVALTVTRVVSEADLTRIALLLDQTDGDTILRTTIDCFDPPAEFDSVSEVLLHPSFVQHTIQHYDCAYLLEGDGTIRRILVEPSKEAESAPRATVTEIVDGKEAADPDFYLKPDWYDTLATLIERGSTVLLIGPAGSGKTQAVEQIFKERDQRLEIVSCTPRTTANDLEGATDLIYEEGQQITRFTLASPALASERGYGLLLDEADAAPSEAMYSMYRLLDGKPMHIVRKGYDGEISLHPNFRVIGTQNTEGRGDDRGLYHGRSYQDEAFLDRWNAVIRVDYPSKEHEILILRKRTAISGAKAEMIVDVATALRNSQQADEIMFTCTMRRTLAVAENIADGFSPADAWALAAVNRATTEDRAKIPEILNRVYGSKLREKKSRRKHPRPVAR